MLDMFELLGSLVDQFRDDVSVVTPFLNTAVSKSRIYQLGVVVSCCSCLVYQFLKSVIAISLAFLIFHLGDELRICIGIPYRLIRQHYATG